MGYIRVPGRNGKTVGKIIVSYGSGYNGEYDHAILLDSVKIGDTISRGQKFGIVEASDVGASHLHFQLNNPGPIDINNYSYIPIDPYRDKTNPLAVSYWTKDNDPQYP
jgi:murein DD-endopeptidase MepM/ murein hydrolase activator NlpD